MANVSFKRGLSAALVAEGFSAQDGVFYLTTDTHRLYVGQQDQLIDLNRYIRYIQSVSELSNTGNAVGDFVFIKGENDNQLCVWDGTQWLQINPDTDTNDNTKVSGITTPTVSSDSTGVTVSFNLQQTTTDVNGIATVETAIPVSFKISSADFATANEVAVGVEAKTDAEGNAAIGVKGAGSDGSEISLLSGSNVGIAVDEDKNITISAIDTTYELNGKDNKIVLTPNIGEATEVAVVSGAKITATVADNTLTIAHSGLVAPTKIVEDEGSLEEGGSITVITGITSTDGHVTGYSEKTYKVPDYADTQYSLGVSQSDSNAKVDLIATGSDVPDSLTLTPGTDVVLTADADAKSVKVAHKAYSNSITPSEGVAQSPDFGGEITALTGVSISNGHITGLETTKYTLPEDVDYSVNSVETTVDNTGTISVKVADTSGASKTGTAEKAIYFKVGSDDEKNIIYNQGVLDVYTKSEIDSKINGIDAMRYKGTVGGEGSTIANLPTENVSVGDTYMVALNGTYGEVENCDIGDLLIATGSESNGIITSKITWTHIPSGDDTDTQFALQVANNVITLQNTTLGDSAGDITVKAGNKINVNTSGNTIEIIHAGLEAPDVVADDAITPASGESINIISGITAEDGHITEYHTQKVTLPASKDYSGNLTIEADHSIKYSDKAGNTGAITFTNDNYITLEDDIEGKSIKIGHKAYNVPLTATALDDITLSAGENFTAVTGMERDAGGHLTKFTTQKITLPADKDTTYTMNATEDETIKLVGTNGDNFSVKFVSGKDINISEHTDEDGIIDGLSVAHASVAHTVSTADAEAPGANKSFNVIKNISVNDQGHVTDVKTVEVTMPENTTYTLSDSVAENGNSFTITMKDSKDNSSDLVFTSKSLSLAKDSSGSIGIELEWGAF